MPILGRGYGAVRNLCSKSGARFPPSTVLYLEIVGASFVSDVRVSCLQQRSSQNSRVAFLRVWTRLTYRWLGNGAMEAYGSSYILAAFPLSCPTNYQ